MAVVKLWWLGSAAASSREAGWVGIEKLYVVVKIEKTRFGRTFGALGTTERVRRVEFVLAATKPRTLASTNPVLKQPSPVLPSTHASTLNSS